MTEVANDRWFITADGQVFQTWTPEGERMKYVRFPTIRTVTLEDLYTLDQKCAELLAMGNSWRAVLRGSRRTRNDFEVAFQEAGLEGAEGHTVNPTEARALITAPGTVSAPCRH